MSESDLGKPQSWETFLNLSNFKFSELFVNEFDYKSSWFDKKSYFWRNLSRKIWDGDVRVK